MRLAYSLDDIAYHQSEPKAYTAVGWNEENDEFYVTAVRIESDIGQKADKIN